uniref:Uncharacterized protein n=1 Tax=Setaria digitata TaxID=48799 RepID=A0A915PCB2_9BILA
MLPLAANNIMFLRGACLQFTVFSGTPLGTSKTNGTVYWICLLQKVGMWRALLLEHCKHSEKGPGANDICESQACRSSTRLKKGITDDRKQPVSLHPAKPEQQSLQGHWFFLTIWKLELRVCVIQDIISPKLQHFTRA